MISILLAIALAQQTTCTVTNLAPLSVVCNEGPQQVELRDFEWPTVEWGKGPHLSGKYNAEIVAGKVFPLPTGKVADNDEIRARTLKEQRRWRRPALQQPIR